MATSKQKRQTSKSSPSRSKPSAPSSRRSAASRSSGQKRPASSRSASKSSTRKGGGRGHAKRRRDYRPRIALGLVLLALAVFSAFGYFDSMHALLIDWLVECERGLFGYGYWVVPPMLLIAALVQLLHGGMPVRLRTTAALLTPALLAALVQSFRPSAVPSVGPEMFPLLWQSGLQMQSAGALGGALAAVLVWALTWVGAALVCLALLTLDYFILTRTTPADIAAFWTGVGERRRERRAQEWDEEADDLVEDLPPEPEPVVLPPRRPAPARRTRRAEIDIPVDAAPTRAEPETPPQKTQESGQPEPAASTGPLPVFQKPERGKEEPLFQERTGGSFFESFFGRDIPVEVPGDHGKQATAPPPPAPASPAKEEGPSAEEAAAEVARDLDEGLRRAEEYVRPPVELLRSVGGVSQDAAQGELAETRERLDDTISSFGIDAHIINVVRGPSVTRYELELERGVKLSKVTNLAGDLALALGAVSVRIAPIPGKSSVVGVEVPNRIVTPVPIREVIASPEFQDNPSSVAFAVGKDISGRNVVGNIARLPHLLIAGTTGSGKSVCTNSLIISLLYKASPEQVRLIMVDPKMVELGIYNGIPHLLIPVVTDPKKAAGALQWAVTEMMKRYRLFSERHVRDLASYNQQLEEDPEALEAGETPLPQIVVVIDELADLMLVAAKEVEEAICRLAQMGRAAGMHLVIATQRPSSDVITGLMKANIPSRIAFAVASSLESRIILDTQGAEKLVGKGDMLYFPLGSGKPQRVQGCLITDEEVGRVIQFIKENSESDYDDSVMQEVEQNARNAEKSGKKGAAAAEPPAPERGAAPDDGDPMLHEAIDVVVETGMASVSMLQRRLKLGYSRAARLVDQMEEKGVVGPFEGSKPRKVLLSKEEWAERKFQTGEAASALDQARAMSEAADQEALAQEVDMPPFEV